ncbi:hypothetical protein C1C91_23285 (plasmid) [Aeromonas caviae]|uniref:Uncharacterized protein n=1 Tax=Aeromonas caviae TaxID=648 RepID=A0A7D5UKQ3_AERCA|nr:hypothetical protein [Aeromonas caviae]QLI60500.1 hypothetical protein C1C91_23285 [Aeromonas caviae]
MSLFDWLNLEVGEAVGKAVAAIIIIVGLQVGKMMSLNDWPIIPKAQFIAALFMVYQLYGAYSAGVSAAEMM